MGLTLWYKMQVLVVCLTSNSQAKRLLKFKHSGTGKLGIQPNRPLKILPFYQVMVFIKASLRSFLTLQCHNNRRYVWRCGQISECRSNRRRYILFAYYYYIKQSVIDFPWLDGKRGLFGPPLYWLDTRVQPKGCGIGTTNNFKANALSLFHDSHSR